MADPPASCKTPFVVNPPSALRRSESNNELGSVPKPHRMVTAQSVRCTSWAGQPESALEPVSNDGGAATNRRFESQPSDCPSAVSSLENMDQRTSSPTCTLSSTSVNLNSSCTKNPLGPTEWSLQETPGYSKPRPISSLHTTEKIAPWCGSAPSLAPVSGDGNPAHEKFRSQALVSRLGWARERHPVFWVSICLVTCLIVTAFVACHIKSQDYVCQRGIGHQAPLCQALITLQCEPLLPCSNDGVSYLTIDEGICACSCPKGFLGKTCQTPFT
ncbi:hypothetical protein IWQ62_000163 [Dispira parvispora]|uniref:EGF-like domain-containing protein n=1 Tax=Dispira parvispora TaxID=1520584 RepID=A0A9W8AVC4_9FUNG|nr:hypothetical protein IWQ62_000163 [Dispira parvispora]